MELPWQPGEPMEQLRPQSRLKSGKSFLCCPSGLSACGRVAGAAPRISPPHGWQSRKTFRGTCLCLCRRHCLPSRCLGPLRCSGLVRRSQGVGWCARPAWLRKPKHHNTTPTAAEPTQDHILALTLVKSTTGRYKLEVVGNSNGPGSAKQLNAIDVQSAGGDHCTGGCVAYYHLVK